MKYDRCLFHAALAYARTMSEEARDALDIAARAHVGAMQMIDCDTCKEVRKNRLAVGLSATDRELAP